MHHLLETWFNWVLTGGYLGIVVLMAMESSIFPVPSEIVIPVGIVRMNFGIFSFVTIAGAALWCWILAYLGDKAYRVEPELLTSPEALEHFIRQQSKGILLVIVVFAALYMLTLRLMKPRSGS